MAYEVSAIFWKLVGSLLKSSSLYPPVYVCCARAIQIIPVCSINRIAAKLALPPITSTSLDE
jgi:hypothetical protein